MEKISKGGKIALGTLITVLVLAVAGLLFAGRYMLGFSLTADKNRSDIDSTYTDLYKRFPDLKPWVDSVSASGALRDTFITTADGRRQHAYYMACAQAQGKTAVMVHGYKDAAIKYFYFMKMYNGQLRYNVLMPELHGHGLSVGEDIQMGWKDADDVLGWISVAENIFHDDRYPSKMILHGVSMGAATTMNASGKANQPEYLNAFIEDCGYTSVWDEFSTQLSEQFGLPSFPLMNITSWMCQLKYGWNFKEASPLESVARCTKPMLMIHGDADAFVPYSMFKPLCDAKPEPKVCWTTAGSKHARSYRDYPEEYTEHVREFLERYNN